MPPDNYITLEILKLNGNVSHRNLSWRSTFTTAPNGSLEYARAHQGECRLAIR
jgi:hypothetical protein